MGVAVDRRGRREGTGWNGKAEFLLFSLLSFSFPRRVCLFLQPESLGLRGELSVLSLRFLCVKVKVCVSHSWLVSLNTQVSVFLIWGNSLSYGLEYLPRDSLMGLLPCSGELTVTLMMMETIMMVKKKEWMTTNETDNTCRKL